jgi:hypothetical protein
MSSSPPRTTPTQNSIGPTTGVSLLYVAGAHRSGATALGAVLAGAPSVFYAGELYRIPHPIFEVSDPSRLCSCGAKADECPFWQKVRARLDSEPGALRALQRGQRRYEVWRALPWTMWKLHRRDPELVDYVQRLGQFIRILSDISGSPVVVESSYNPVRGLLYDDPASGLDVRFLHLVRDGRNLIDSEKRSRDSPEVRWSALRTTPVIVGRWVAYHLLALLLLPRGDPYRRMRYEEIMREPGSALRSIGDFIRVDFAEPVRRVETGQAIPMRHIVAGNRIRLQGRIVLRPELANLPRLTLGSRIVFWGLGGWLALALGYRPARTPLRAPPPEDGGEPLPPRPEFQPPVLGRTADPAIPAAGGGRE